MKKYNITLILLTVLYNYNIAQPLQYNGENVDTIIIESTYIIPHTQKGYYKEEDVYILYYDSDIDDFKIGSYIKMKQQNGKKKQKIIRKYDSLYNSKEKIQNLFSAIEQTYKPVNLSDFDINENNIGTLIDSTFLLWYKKYRLRKKLKNIKKCKNIDDFRTFLTEQSIKINQTSTGSYKGFSICIKTSLNTYHICSSGFYDSMQPWYKYNADFSSRVVIINFDINNSLLEILPKDFFNIIDLTRIGVIQEYLKWCCWSCETATKSIKHEFRLRNSPR